MRKPTLLFQRACCFAAVTLLPACMLTAQVVPAPTAPQVGSSNPVTAAPLVPRPHTKPCVVQLFSNIAFDNFTPATFSYTPPAGCPGPWAKVVFTADFTVTAGTQFDRTAAFYLGHANIFYGTTAEPRASLSPSWHVERDVTDLSAIFKSAQTGEANIGNFVGVYQGVNYNGIIYASAALEFYPASYRDRAPRTPNIVIPINGAGGDAGTLNTTTDTISQTVTLPQNVEQVYLDVIAQNQSNDEFFYLNVPNNETSNLESNGGTAFREVEVTIDGKPAGVAPVYPWIFTGGIDPYLWEPIPGNQTLEFKPYRVNLTPFAGVLDDGNAHTVAISVYNADSYFLATANLLVYTGHRGGSMSGGLISDTLSAAPSPVVDENISYNPTTSAYTGSIGVTSNRRFTISGYVNTPHGRVVTTVKQNVNFSNVQQFDVTPTVDGQDAVQDTTVDSWTTTQQGRLTTTKEQHFNYPLTVDYNYTANADGSADQTVSVKQGYHVRTADGLFNIPIYTSRTNEETTAQDKLVFNTDGTVVPEGAQTTQTYRFRDNRGQCYGETLTAANQVLTGVKNNGCGYGRGW